MDFNHLEQHWAPRFRSVLRIMAGLLFLEHGTSKIFGIPASGMSGDFHLFSLAGFSGLLELVGGVLLVLGLFTHITAFILSGEMTVAYFMVHISHGFFPMVNKGEIAVLYCFVFLFLAVAGAGPWSLDHFRNSRKALKKKKK